MKTKCNCFSENAISETVAEGKTILKLEGRKEMAQAFDNFLRDVETIYHFNGQQVVKINGNNSVGKWYCLITLLGSENGKNIKTTIGATYKVKYIRINNKLLVSRRGGNFKRQDKTEIKS
ncbi:nuclear transport factor 2 family protein [Adhaeribacter radiodurans]|uniref:nuclear transport factor 2 family protein n=1 Tax=Adhaeribacter radiodurans TaxID=2745197 RepID=UPI001C70BBCC|nr:nuclear transport factor 2 family protein [Adhaeribacter radiodurans]